MTDESQNIYILDDDEAVRESLAALLEIHGYNTRSFSTATAFLEILPAPEADCLLLDVRLPDMDGLEVLKKLSVQTPSLPVIMITGHGDVPMAVEALHAGASDFIEKPFDDHKLVDAMKKAIAAKLANVAGTIIADPGIRVVFDRLTPREFDVLHQMVIGHPNKIIAHNLGLSPRTVEIHRSRVLEKTEAQSLSHLVRMAVKAGLDPDEDVAAGE